jgi:hypothetical protein
MSAQRGGSIALPPAGFQRLVFPNEYFAPTV